MVLLSMLIDFSLAIARKETVWALEFLVLDPLQNLVFLLLVVTLDLMEVVVPKPVEKLPALGADEPVLFLETDAAFRVRRTGRLRVRHRGLSPFRRG